MFNLKNTMIAAAALASLAVPGAAYAGKTGQAVKYYHDQIHNARDEKHQLKADFKSGNLNISRALYRQLIAGYVSEIDGYQDAVQDLKASR